MRNDKKQVDREGHALTHLHLRQEGVRRRRRTRGAYRGREAELTGHRRQRAVEKLGLVVLAQMVVAKTELADGGSLFPLGI